MWSWQDPNPHFPNDIYPLLARRPAVGVEFWLSRPEHARWLPSSWESNVYPMGGTPESCLRWIVLCIAEVDATISQQASYASYTCWPQAPKAFDLSHIARDAFRLVRHLQETMGWTDSPTEPVRKFSCPENLRDMLQVLEQVQQWVERGISSEKCDATALEGWTRHPFGILVDPKSRIVTREKYEGKVDLSSSTLGWHIFTVVLNAAPDQASVANLKEGYPGEWDARGTAVNDLNARLLPLKIRVEARTLKEIQA